MKGGLGASDDLGPVLAALRAARTADGTLTIDNHAYGPSIATLLDAWFAGGKTVLTATTEPQLNADQSRVVFTGGLSLLAGAVTSDRTDVSFYFIGDSLEVGFDAAMPSGYALGDSFPIYAVGLVAEVPLGDVHWLLRSDGADAALAEQQVGGLNFRADLDLGKLAPVLGMLFGDGALTLTGPAALDADGVPQVLVRADLATLPISKGLSLPLVVAWETQTVRAPGGGSWATCGFSLSTSIAFSVGGVPQSLALSCDWNLGTVGLLVFSIVDGVLPIACALEDLATLLVPNQFDFAGAFGAYSPTPGLALYDTTLVVRISPTGVAIETMSLGIICDAQWQLFKDFRVDQITAELIVDDPLHAGEVRCVIGSVCEVAGGKVDLSAILSSGRPVFDGALEDGSAIDLGKFVGDLFPGVSLPRLTIDQFDFEVVPGESYAATVRFSDNWSIPLGPLSLALPAVTFDGGYGPRPGRDPGPFGTISADFIVSTAALAVTYDLSGDFQLKGTIPRLSLASLLHDLSWTWPSSLPDVAVTDATLWFDRDPNNTYRMTITGDVDGLGQLAILVCKSSDGTWGFGGGFVHQGDVSLEAIDWMPAPLKAIHFQELALMAASFTDPKFQIPGISFPGAPAGISAGVLLYAELSMEHLGLGGFAKSLRIPDLAVFADLGIATESLTIGAGIARPITLTSFATIPTFQLSLTAGVGVLDIALSMGVQFVIHGQTLLFTGMMTLAVDPPTVALSLLYTGDWNPFGSIVVQRLGVQVSLEEAGAAFAIAGAVALTPNVALSLGCEVVLTEVEVPVPDYIQGALTGEVTLSDLVGLAIPGGVPPTVAPLLAVTVRDFSLYLVLNPAGVMLFGQLYPPGFASQGTLVAYGMTVAYKIKIDPFHLAFDVDGSVSGVDLDGVVSIPEAAVTIHFAAAAPLDTQFSIVGHARVLGAAVDLTVRATVSPPQFVFSFTESLWGLGSGAVVATAGLGSLGSAGFSVSAHMQADFLDWLSGQLSNAIRDATGSAQDALSKAIDAVNAAQRKVDDIPDHWWDWPAKKAAEAALDLAKDFLRGLRAELGAAGVVAGWIIDNGGRAIVNVNAASFDGQLSVVNGGQVSLRLAGTVIGQGFQLPSVDFSFPSPADAIKRIADQLIHLV